MKTLALFSIKGGVGKTTAAVNLASSAATEGQRVLLIDLDAQGAATFYLRVEPAANAKGRRFWNGKGDPRRDIRGSDLPGLDLLPAQDHLRRADATLESLEASDRRLRRLLRDLASDYDLVVLDCPPGLDLLAENVVRAADLVLVPTVPTWLSLRLLAPLDVFVADHGRKSIAIHPFLTLVQSRNRDHQEAVSQLRDREPRLLATAIPLTVDIERMGRHRLPVACFAERSPGARAFKRLWQEVDGLLATRSI